MEKKFWIKKIIGFIVMAIICLAILAYVVMLLWNGVLVKVVPVSMVSYSQALGILLLSKILFGGFKGGWGSRYKDHWKQKMEHKWQQLSPEEREKIKEEWRNRCRIWKRGNQDDNAGS